MRTYSLGPHPMKSLTIEPTIIETSTFYQSEPLLWQWHNTARSQVPLPKHYLQQITFLRKVWADILPCTTSMPVPVPLLLDKASRTVASENNEWPISIFFINTACKNKHLFLCTIQIDHSEKQPIFFILQKLLKFKHSLPMSNMLTEHRYNLPQPSSTTLPRSIKTNIDTKGDVKEYLHNLPLSSNQHQITFEQLRFPSPSAYQSYS
jgi:hypothetical protein